MMPRRLVGSQAKQELEQHGAVERMHMDVFQGGHCLPKADQRPIVQHAPGNHPEARMSQGGAGPLYPFEICW